MKLFISAEAVTFNLYEKISEHSQTEKNNLLRFSDSLGHTLLRAAQNKWSWSTGAPTGHSSAA